MGMVYVDRKHGQGLRVNEIISYRFHISNFIRIKKKNLNIDESN